jgi:glycopeptide antibiotics resistance protein
VGDKATLGRLDKQTSSWKCEHRVGGRLRFIVYINVLISFISLMSKQSSKTDKAYYYSISDVYLPDRICIHIISFRLHTSPRMRHFCLRFIMIRTENQRRGRSL